MLKKYLRTDFLFAQAMGYEGPQLDDSEGVNISDNVEEYSYLEGKVRHYKMIGEGHGTGPGNEQIRDIIRTTILGKQYDA